MTFTVSHRQAGTKRSSVGGLVRHEFRDVDKHNGVETQHSNERIIPERTRLNESVMWVDGKEVALTDSRQITDELDRRLADAGGTRTNKKTGKVTKVAVREDAKVVRDIVLQLDPQFTRSSARLLDDDEEDRREEVRDLLGEMVQHYADLYGQKNLLAASLHWDETSPHVHLLVTPIDEQGRVRQESFIKGRQAMKDNDRAMRRRLEEVGYDVDRQPRGGNRSNMSIDEYAQWQESIEKVAAEEVEVADRAVKVRVRESDVNARERSLDAREAAVSARESEVGVREAEAMKTSQRASQELSEAKAAKAEYLEGVKQARAVRSAVEALENELIKGSRVVKRDVYRDRVQPAQERAKTALRGHSQWLMSKSEDTVEPEGPEIGE